ncbi:GNAT family N-acetyltransferase [Microvirga sp. GCM10011540]|uniref:GNAT family N-acetyltransferase n=1 Tax=Microvirga sp. GCM10011540 TaxID=3317338 RepID=UPI0036178A90
MISACPDGFHTVAVSDFKALEPHRAAWDRLAWHAPQQLPNLLPAWAEACFRSGLGPNERWMCCFAYSEGRLAGVLPVIVAPHPLLGERWPLLRTANRQSPSGDIVLSADRAPDVLRALLAELGRQVPTHVSLELKAVRRNSPVRTALEGGAHGYIPHGDTPAMLSRLDVTGSFEAYMASLGKMRRNVRIGRKRLESRGRVSVEMRRGSDARTDFMPEFLALEASGWKGRNGTAMLNDPASAAFHTALVENFAAQGRLEWHMIRVDGRLVAAGIGVRCGSALMLPKYAFDEDFSDCMPGSLLTEEIFRDVFSRPEIEEVNHMSYSESDRLWHMSSDSYATLHLVRRSAVTLLMRLPRLVAQSAYRVYVQPRIPAVVKEAHRKFQRRGGRRPPRINACGDVLQS